MNILCISSRLHPGVTSVFKNQVKVMDCKHIFAEDFSPEDLENIHLVILGAWTQLYNEIIPTIKCKKAILWTSTMLQMELSPNSVELELFRQLEGALEKNYYDYLLIGDRNLAMYSDNENVHHFPYPIGITPFVENPLKWKDDNVNFGLFTVAHARKNRANQATATMLACKSNPSIILYTNCFQYNHPNINCFEWLEKDHYDQQMERIHFGLNVFPSESFCYSFVELMMKGIPTICSLTVANNFYLQDDYWADSLVVYDCDNLLEIQKKIEHLASLPVDEKINLSLFCRDYMVEFAEKNNIKLKQLMRKLSAN